MGFNKFENLLPGTLFYPAFFWADSKKEKGL